MTAVRVTLSRVRDGWKKKGKGESQYREDGKTRKGGKGGEGIGGIG